MYVKNHSNLSNFIFIEEYQFRRRFFFIVIFGKLQFLNHFVFLKWCPIFDGPCEHMWKSNQKIIFILLIFLLKSNLLTHLLKTPPQVTLTHSFLNATFGSGEKKKWDLPTYSLFRALIIRIKVALWPQCGTPQAAWWPRLKLHCCKNEFNSVACFPASTLKTWTENVWRWTNQGIFSYNKRNKL